jgi:hypothetical protein
MAFLATVDIDATSTIHFYNNPQNLASTLTSNTWGLLLTQAGAPASLISGLAMVHSLTPGYTPEAEFTFGPGGEPIGVTIVDKPIIAAHT